MEYRRLGSTGLEVSPIALGTMMFGARGNPDHEECTRILHAALDAGVNLVDTANAYSEGESETIVGKALRGRRDDVVLATKVHFPTGPGPNRRGNGRVHILREVENSLRRLQTDHVDLYQIHRPDPLTPIEETLSALDDLVRAGKVRYVGTSAFEAWRLVESYWVSERRNLVRFTCEQPPYSILRRASERDVLPVCARYGTGTIVYSPLDRGWLAGRYQRGARVGPESRLRRRDPIIVGPSTASGRARRRIVAALEPLARELDVTLAQYALAWTLANPAVTAPIVGPRTPEQFEELVPAAGLRIPDEHLREIDELVPPGTDV